MFSNELNDANNQTDNIDVESKHNEPATITAIPPPPIFIIRINNFTSFCNSIKKLTKGGHFSCKSSLIGVKLSNHSTESYHLVMEFFQVNKVNSHIDQIKEDRSCRVIIKNLHHTTVLDKIKI